MGYSFLENFVLFMAAMIMIYMVVEKFYPTETIDDKKKNAGVNVDYNKLTKPQLLDAAKAKGLKVTSKMNKAQIISVLKES
jgi:hypothetical protein